MHVDRRWKTRAWFTLTSGSIRLQMLRLRPATDVPRRHVPMMSHTPRFWFCIPDPNCDKHIRERNTCFWTYGLVPALCVRASWGRRLHHVHHYRTHINAQVNVWEILCQRHTEEPRKRDVNVMAPPSLAWRLAPLIRFHALLSHKRSR